MKDGGRAWGCGGGAAWGESYGYDPYGNRWVSSHTGLLALQLDTPQAPGWYIAGNRLNSWGYDARGNISSVNGMPQSFSYDGEDRQKTATINGVVTTYSYDGEGRRVKTQVTAGRSVQYLYDAFGLLTAEVGPPAENVGTNS